MNSKTKFKNLISTLSLCFTMFILTGCASVDYSRFIYPNGAITDKIVIELDGEKVINSGISIDYLATTIKTDLDNFFVLPVKTFINNFMANDAFTLEQKNAVSSGIKANAEIIDTSKIYAEINFASTALFNIFYGAASDGESKEEELDFREGAFVNKYVQSTQNAFAVIKTDAAKVILKKYEKMFDGVYDINDVKLTQVYASPNTNIFSNANEVETMQGVKMHQWDIDANKLDFNLEFYTKSPRASSWYILALFATLMVTFVTYCYIRKEIIKKNNQQKL